MLVKPVNISQTCFNALSTCLCTYVELDTVLSLEDALNIIEFNEVKKYNDHRVNEILKDGTTHR